MFYYFGLKTSISIKLKVAVHEKKKDLFSTGYHGSNLFQQKKEQ